MTTAEQVQALRAIGDAILELVAAAGPLGAPSGYLYAALMPYGCTLEQYLGIMAGLERAGLVTQNSHCYHLAENGKKYVATKGENI